MSRLEPDRALVPARARNPGHRQLRHRTARAGAAASRLELVEGSIADRDLVRRAFRAFRATHVVHSAASYKDPTDWREDVATNVQGTINLVEAARAIGVDALRQFPDRAVLRPAAAEPDPGGSSARGRSRATPFRKSPASNTSPPATSAGSRCGSPM